MDGLQLTILGLASLPFVSYGVAGVWARITRPKAPDPATILATRYAKGEIGHEEYERRLSMLTYGPSLVVPPPIRHEALDA